MERGGVVCQAGERHKQRPRGKTPLEWSGTGVGLSPGVAGLSKAATAVKVRGQLICRASNAQLGRLEYVRGIREPEEEQMRRALLGVQSPEKPQIYLAETGRAASKMEEVRGHEAWPGQFLQPKPVLPSPPGVCVGEEALWFCPFVTGRKTPAPTTAQLFFEKMV